MTPKKGLFYLGVYMQRSYLRSHCSQWRSCTQDIHIVRYDVRTMKDQSPSAMLTEGWGGGNLGLLKWHFVCPCLNKL